MDNYIVQNMNKYINYDHFKKTLDNDYLSYFDQEIIKPSFNELYDNRYLMVIGEPGFGKTRLLKEIVLKTQNGVKAYFIDAKKIENSIIATLPKCKKLEDTISEEELQKEVFFSNTTDISLDENSIICLDALDELPFPSLYNFFEQVEEFLNTYPKIILFISCRTHHLNKVDYDLTKLPFQYITLSNFYSAQIIQYLEFSLTPEEIKNVEEKTKLTELFNFISIPRYLYYFSELIKNKKLEEIIGMSRAEMFEHFIYRKLDDERKKDTNINHAKYDVIKRVLEKIAVIMKINQVSQISKDELFTIFDNLDSSFSHIVFREDLIEIFFEKSIIKDNIDFIEFENQEFLDYLAAKELCRFDKVDQVFFDLAVEPHIKEVFTSWFYVLPFILEQNRFMIELVLDFLEKKSNEALRENYFHVLTAIESQFLSLELKNRIFNLIFNYFNEHNKWFSHIEKIVYFYDEKLHYKLLVQSIDEKKYSEDELHVRRNNAVDLIEHLARHNKLSSDKIDFWKNQFYTWLRYDVKKYRMLHQNILHCLPLLVKGDLKYIKKIYFIFKKGIELQHQFARLCFLVSPEDSFSIDTYFNAHDMYKKNKITTALTSESSIEYIFELKTKEAIYYMLKKLTDENMKNHFYQLRDLKYGDKYKKDFEKLLKNITPIRNEEVILFLKKIVKFILDDRYVRYQTESKYFLETLIDYLFKNDSTYLFELLEYIFDLFTSRKIHFHDIVQIIDKDLIKYLDNDNFEQIYTLLKKFETESMTIDSLLYRIYMKENVSVKIKKIIFEKHKDFIEQQNEELEKYRKKEERDSKNRQIGLCKQWEHKIEPEANKYITDLFRFFNNNKTTLQQCKDYRTNRNKTLDIAKDVLKNYNPLTGRVNKEGSSSTIWGVHHFKDCIELLYQEKEDLTSDQIIIDNIFRHLPFDINSDYEVTFNLASNPSSEAIQDILDVYAGKREDDLDIFHPINFIEFYKMTQLQEAETLLLKMIESAEIESYIKERVLEVLPKTVLTKEWIETYIQVNGKKDKLYEKMLITLIRNFNDSNAIETVFEILVNTAKNVDVPEAERTYLGSDLDDRRNPLVFALTSTNYPLEKDQELLLLGSKLRGDGKNINGQFLEEIVFRHLKYLKHQASFEPIILIEHFLQVNQDNINLKWFEYKLIELKEMYLAELSKPSNISESIKKYNELREKDYLVVRSSSHLLEIIKQSINHDIRQWIEDEGAYKYVNELSQKKNRKNAEDFIQKTIKSQIELSLLKKGLRKNDINIKREEQLLDDKRIDFTVSYGFIGSILIELKLANNNESKTGKVGKNYVNKLKSYIDGSSANYGIFLVFNIRSTQDYFNNQIEKLTKLYGYEKNITVLGINCKV